MTTREGTGDRGTIVRVRFTEAMRAPVLLLLTLLIAAGGTGCSAAQDTVDSASAAARSAAAAEVRDQVEKQVCQLIEDNKLSAADKEKLRTVLEQARKVDLPDEITEPLNDLVTGSDTAQDISDLKAALSAC